MQKKRGMPKKSFQEAKYLHFSGWPVPKPWSKALTGLIEELQPPCELNPGTSYKYDCRVKDLWLGVSIALGSDKRVYVTLL
ncbi:hypothetical protein N7453_001021 [Penicillium expansum]|nr:hypothetical protein N7453_001021 [Penicillium expansum]